MGTTGEVRIRNATRQLDLAARARVAGTRWSRARGLIGAPRLEAGQALVIRPSMGVHTCFMSYPIDVVHVDRTDRVLDLEAEMPPWRLGGLRVRARCVIELPAGIIRATGTQVGDQLRFEPADRIR